MRLHRGCIIWPKTETLELPPHKNILDKICLLQMFIKHNLELTCIVSVTLEFFLWNLNFRQVKILGIRLYNIKILAKTFECRHSSHVEFTFSIIWPYTAWSWFSAVHQEFSQMAKMEYICQGYIKTSGTLVSGIDVAQWEMDGR